MGLTRTLVIVLVGIVIPLVIIVIVLLGHTRSMPPRSTSSARASLVDDSRAGALVQMREVPQRTFETFQTPA
jgi:hypothetical protein